jgi:hypothetical protein
MSLREAERRQRQHNNIGKARQWLGGGRSRWCLQGGRQTAHQLTLTEKVAV